MKVIPSAMVSSKLFSVSANTVPFKGGKSHSSSTSLKVEQGHALGLQIHESVIFFKMLLCRLQSHKEIPTQPAFHRLYTKGGWQPLKGREISTSPWVPSLGDAVRRWLDTVRGWWGQGLSFGDEAG